MEQSPPWACSFSSRSSHSDGLAFYQWVFLESVRLPPPHTPPQQSVTTDDTMLAEHWTLFQVSHIH